MLCSASTKRAGKEFVTKSVDSRSLPRPSPRSRITSPVMHPDISSYVKPLSLTPCDDSLKTVFVVNGACLHQRGKCVPYRRILYETHTFRTSCLLPCESTHLDVQGNPRATEKMPQNLGDGGGGGGGGQPRSYRDGRYMVINRWPVEERKIFPNPEISAAILFF